MILTLSIMMSSSIAFTMMLAYNPISLGLMILFMALLLSITFAYAMSSWLAFLIFLIYIGGMLIMFSYFVAIIPNQHLYITHILILSIMMMASMSISMYFINMSSQINSVMISQLNILYTKSNMYMLIMLASILLYTMIVVVKLAVLSKGPLRPFI